MAEISEHSVTRYPLRVRFCETDLMGIVHHANYLTYFEAARVEYLRRRGVDYGKEWVEQDAHLPVIEVGLEYKKPSRFDDALVVEARLAQLTRVTVRFEYRVLRATDDGEELVCKGFTVLACIGGNGRPRRMPSHLAEVVCGPELPARG